MLPIRDMDALTKAFEGKASFWVKDLATGSSHSYNPDVPMPTASVCKVPVMLELFRRAHEGTLSLDERRTLSGKISRHGSGVLSSMADAPTMTLRDYCRLMITVSDDIATDVLINLLTPDAINATLESMGFQNTRTSMTMGAWHYSYAGITGEPSPEKDRVLAQVFAKSPPSLDNPAYSSALTNNVA
ncbi:MAG: serine hydrolase [SAR202 cluster bacterium]|nr:serine hydrolase [SAR202 cluster bacterium]